MMFTIADTITATHTAATVSRRHIKISITAAPKGTFTVSKS
jgi:hypothetical protein